ncbi:MAG TPA: DNA adenine methylase, partial [Flavobacterium sp.]|nr:DNA adenine methylase [Flavobacterium sp.]
MAIISASFELLPTKPILKWAGGKTQLLIDLNLRAPKSYNKYIEPFFGGGALFFNLHPDEAVIADSNPELINLYKCVATDPNEVLSYLSTFKNDHDFFYELRAQDMKDANPSFAAARTIFLNKTCFNGLYRVNKNGQFNVPFGRYKNPKLVDIETVLNASKALQHTKIICGDYKTVLRDHAEEGDFVFLDPPYLPISKYSDFKRYTKEQFYEEDQRELADEVHRLHEKGCHIILTNSNHPLVHELYGDYKVEILQTKRYINSNSSNRVGEDVVVTAIPKNSNILRVVPDLVPNQVDKYPSTRWMGSKSKLLPHIQNIA